MSKKTLLLSAALLLGLVVLGKPALAADFRADKQMVSVNASDAVNGDLYAASSNVTVDADMPGDAFLAGSMVRVTGNTAQSLYAAGSMVNVTGNVGHALRVAGSQVTIGGTIEGDVMAAGGMVYILPGAVIKGDLYVGGGAVNIDGQVLGSVKAGAGEMMLRGEVGRDVFGDVENLNLGSQAKIGGNLAYRGQNEATISPGASIAGIVNFQKTEKPATQAKAEHRGMNWGLGILLFVFFWIMYVVLALLGNHFFKQRIADITTYVLDDFVKQTGWGFIWLVVIPAACIVLLFTLIGIPVSVFGLLFYCLVLGLAKVMSGIVLGTWLMKLMSKKRGIVVDWKAILLGVTVLLLIACIPVLGWIFGLIFTLAALGGLMSALKPIIK